jgi:hypothetical protein
MVPVIKYTVLYFYLKIIFIISYPKFVNWWWVLRNCPPPTPMLRSLVAPFLRMFSKERYKTYTYMRNTVTIALPNIGCNLDVSYRILAVMYPQKAPYVARSYPLQPLHPIATPAPTFAASPLLFVWSIARLSFRRNKNGAKLQRNPGE